MHGEEYPTSVPLFKNPSTSSFSSTMRAPSTPYPYYQRNPPKDFGHKHSTSFQKTSQSFIESPFDGPFDPTMIKKPSSFFPKENSYPDFSSSGHHDEHIKNFPLEDFHMQNSLLNEEGDDVMIGVDVDLTPNPTISPKRKKKFRGSRPNRNKNKTPNIFESYFNALRDGLKLPTLSAIRGGKKDKTRLSSAGGMKKRRKRKRPVSWNEEESFMGDFMGNTDDIFR